MNFPSSGLSVAFAAAHSRAAGGDVDGEGADGLDPVTVSEAKAHLYVSHSADDAYIGTLVSAARRAIERELGLAMLTQEVTAQYRGPAAALEAPVGPVQSVTSITRKADGRDADDPILTDNITVLDRRIALTSGRNAGHGADTVTLVYEAGFGDDPADVPADLKHAVKVWVADLYTMRGSFDAGSLAVAAFPGAVRALLDGYRRLTV